MTVRRMSQMTFAFSFRVWHSAGSSSTLVGKAAGIEAGGLEMTLVDQLDADASQNGNW